MTPAAPPDPLGGLPRGGHALPGRPGGSPPPDVRLNSARPSLWQRLRQRPATASLLGALVAIFLLQLWANDRFGDEGLAAFRLGALFAPAVSAGELDRLGAAAALHFGLAHLAMNCAALWVLMGPLEEVFGALDALGLFASTALVGGAASFLGAHLAGEAVLSAGASGGAFGLFGATATLVFRLRPVLPREVFRAQLRAIFTNLAINLALFLALSVRGGGVQLDNRAHVAGFLSGLLLGMLPAFTRRRASSPPQRARTLRRIPLLAGLLLLVGCEVVALGRAARPEARFAHLAGHRFRLPWMMVPTPTGAVGPDASLRVEVGAPLVPPDLRASESLDLDGRRWELWLEADDTLLLASPEGEGRQLRLHLTCLSRSCSGRPGVEWAVAIAGSISR